jgi:hypothetical protein
MDLQNIFWQKPSNKTNQFNTLFNNTNNMSGGEAL